MSILFYWAIYSDSASTLLRAALNIIIKKQIIRSVDNTDGEFISSLKNLSSLSGGNVMSNFSTVSVVVHHKEFKILNITNSELVKSVRKHEASSLIRTITNVGHESSTSETTSATTINTLRLSPVLLWDYHSSLTSTFILLNLSAWKRGKETVLFFTIFTLRTGLIVIYRKVKHYPHHTITWKYTNDIPIQ